MMDKHEKIFYLLVGTGLISMWIVALASQDANMLIVVGVMSIAISFVLKD